VTLAALLVVPVIALIAWMLPGSGRATATAACPGAASADCGVSADGDHYQGLIAVDDAPWVLNLGVHAGTTPGCGDCRWTLVIDCGNASVFDPDSLTSCVGATTSSSCDPGQVRYRLYLTTDARTDVFEGRLCLGNGRTPVPIGERAESDVSRYLRDVTPPRLEITTRPAGTTLAGLPTFFVDRPPGALLPVTFGDDPVHETITVVPSQVQWSWDGGSGSGWVSPGRPIGHAFDHGGTAIAVLVTRWAASYTVQYQGESFGPYDATGQVIGTQQLRLRVLTSEPVLVSAAN
jgi:hypothetical protein